MQCCCSIELSGTPRPSCRAQEHDADLPPSRSPEPNPVENIWQCLRQNGLINQVSGTYDAIVNAACQAWRNLVDRPTTTTRPECVNVATPVNRERRGWWGPSTITGALEKPTYRIYIMAELAN